MIMARRRALRRLRRTSLIRRSRPNHSSTARMSRLHRRRRTRAATISQITISPATTRRVGTPRGTTTTVRISRKSMLPSRLRRCRNTSNPIARETTISGRRDIGFGRPPAITGCPERGYSRRMLERCGHRDIGDSPAVAMAGITATGDRTSVSTVALTMATVISEAAIKVATGTAARFITTGRLLESITTFATFIRATSATTTVLVSATTEDMAD